MLLFYDSQTAAIWPAAGHVTDCNYVNRDNKKAHVYESETHKNMLCKVTTLPAMTLKFLYGDGALINVRHLLLPFLCSVCSRVIEFLPILKEFIGRLLFYIQESWLTGQKFIKYIN